MSVKDLKAIQLTVAQTVGLWEAHQHVAWFGLNVSMSAFLYLIKTRYIPSTTFYFNYIYCAFMFAPPPQGAGRLSPSDRGGGHVGDGGQT